MMAVAPIITDLIFIIEDSAEGEWEDQVTFLPI